MFGWESGEKLLKSSNMNSDTLTSFQFFYIFANDFKKWISCLIYIFDFRPADSLQVSVDCGGFRPLVRLYNFQSSPSFFLSLFFMSDKYLKFTSFLFCAITQLNPIQLDSVSTNEMFMSKREWESEREMVDLLGFMKIKTDSSHLRGTC